MPQHMNAGGLKMQGPNLELCKPQSPRVRLSGKWTAAPASEAQFTPGPGAYPSFGGVGQKPAPHMRSNPPSFSFGGARRMGHATAKVRAPRQKKAARGESREGLGSGLGLAERAARAAKQRAACAASRAGPPPRALPSPQAFSSPRAF